MREVGVYEAKTQLPRLLEAVEKGETIVITRHGKPVARLIPAKRDQSSIDEAIRELREFSKTHSLGGLKPKDLVNEGRKY